MYRSTGNQRKEGLRTIVTGEEAVQLLMLSRTEGSLTPFNTVKSANRREYVVLRRGCCGVVVVVLPIADLRLQNGQLQPEPYGVTAGAQRFLSRCDRPMYVQHARLSPTSYIEFHYR